ncbi:hypothetical protein CC80DRAFT_81404 [Byssothecium circinans]|uniref:Uncharacterized protein n=1 Tax=Byssothecium circinans TaxID=147558 RepID=A0A6A5TW54_9PLEO|nr:hypothetical protein CC80DRAFT_81404 [Byssothecium circinans]
MLPHPSSGRSLYLLLHTLGIQTEPLHNPPSSGYPLLFHTSFSHPRQSLCTTISSTLVSLRSSSFTPFETVASTYRTTESAAHLRLSSRLRPCHRPVACAPPPSYRPLVWVARPRLRVLATEPGAFLDTHERAGNRCREEPRNRKSSKASASLV